MLKRFVFISFLLILLFSCASTSSGKGGNRSVTPDWVNDVYSVFNRSRYVAATGFARDRATAEGNALAALTAYFGQTVQVERTAATSYQQAIVNGVMDGWVDSAEMRTNIRTTSSFDNLMGAEIREVWFDSRGTYYAVAVLEKAKGIQIYNDLIRANLNIINNLVTMTNAQKNSLDGFIRFWFASAVADVNAAYRNIVVLLDGTAPANIISGDVYRLEAQNIIKTIPVNIRVNNDRNGRIYGAFARRFADWGIEASTVNSRYVLDVDVTLSPVDLPNNPNIFVRIELAANLRDTNQNLALIPYTFNSREGHTSMAEAENRAIAAAERNINEVFAVLLSDYLSKLMPRN
ncbi:MAG: LPP20 family lipoprotein [Treponema sp.]|nr:LPP20 family lipoprotein [Treponema sp.]